MQVTPIVQGRDIIVSDEYGDSRVLIDSGSAVCTCGVFRVERDCKHLKYLKELGYEFKIKKRPKDGYDYFLTYGDKMMEVLDARWK